MWAEQEAPHPEDHSPTPGDLVRRYWWVSLLGGLVAAAAGILLLSDPGRTLDLVSIALGIYLIFWGAMQLLGGLEAGGEEGRTLRAVLGLLGIVAGVLVVTRPVRGVTVIGLAFGAYLLISAATALVGALAGQRDRSLGVMRGVADLVAGLIVVSWPGIGLLALAIVLGVYLVARGVLDVSGALAVRRGRIT